MTIADLIDEFSDAIAFAEGYYVAGSRADVNNNPGNLTLDLTGRGIGWDGPFVKYATALDGWDALQKQVRMMIEGTSNYYNPFMSIQEIANKYTATQPLDWARNVASRLGVSVNTTLDDLLTPATAIAGVGIVILAVVVYLALKR